ncbi:N-acetylmuramoyl-L-alanine amidase family protein [Desulforamulus ferrireducens]|uniref:Cell wall hydrolase n=1 Tax=Desulforamulus ferrireducens TaxID=1833852 RepID=A0A1S6IYZ6_9FIRM|nr:N-acetylmuramoyl-L-alanine amidase [Desulforamulus ferrireducens]AQS59992.1 cell wall hydrolase [Desulforamulus ferrireducens]
MFKGPYKQRLWRKNNILLVGLILLVVISLACFSRQSINNSEAEENRGGTSQKKPLPQPVVIIDPGHGGSDPGACQGGVMEKDINLAIAKRVAPHLKPLQVYLTRDKDRDFIQGGVYSKAAERQDLEQRIQLANRYKGELFISIHVNSGVEQLSGVDIYYDPDDHESSQLAQIMQQEMNKLPGMTVRQPRPEKFYLFEHLEIPVIIVETGWLCHPEDRQRLQDPDYQEQVAQAISRGVKRYLAK